MWGIFSHTGLVDKKPCWYYKLGGSSYFLESIVNQPRVVIIKNVAYFRTNKFYGPVIAFFQKNIDGLDKYILSRSRGIPESENITVKINVVGIILKLSNKKFYTNSSEKYQPGLKYNRSEDLIKLTDVKFNDWDILVIMARLFANYLDIAYFITIRIRWQNQELDVNLNKLLVWVFKKDTSFVSESIIKYFNFLENEFKLSESVIVHKIVANELYPFDKIEVLGNNFTGWTAHEGEPPAKDWSVDCIEAPSFLVSYIEREFKTYAIEQAIDYDNLMKEHTDYNDNDSGYDYREITRDGLDNLRQADPEWYWNID